MIARVRRLIAEDGMRLALVLREIGSRRDPAESLTSEVIPLADAARFLVRHAAGLLAPRRLGVAGRPAWLFGVTGEIRREPFGTVLILCPGNYPLLLPGVQLLQALVAGNAVLVKPAPGTSAPLRQLISLLHRAGLPADLCLLLPDSQEAGEAAVSAGIDLVVLTGSTETGRRVLAAAASGPVPAIAELGGHDPVFLLPGADLDLAARALAYALRLNAGATCIAPRRVFGSASMLEALEPKLQALLDQLPDTSVRPAAQARIAALLRHLPAGAFTGGLTADGRLRPTLVRNAPADSPLLHEDLFAPILVLLPAETPAAALEAASRSPYALGAAIFGPPAMAHRLARAVRAGIVVVNDIVVPTADPRLPFGGRGHSGYGVTRGAEGLLALTAVKVITTRAGRFRPHYDPLQPGDAALFSAYLQAAHGAAGRLAALFRLLRGLSRRRR